VLHIGPGIHPRAVKSTPVIRNTARGQLIQQLADALRQYHHDHGDFPGTLPATSTQICTSSGPNCAQRQLLDLSFLVSGGNYVPGIPQDPLGGQGLWGSGFYLTLLSDGSFQITAPKAESDKQISVTSQP